MSRDFLEVLKLDPALRRLPEEELVKVVYLRDKRALPDDLKRLFDRVAVIRLTMTDTHDIAAAMDFGTGEVAGVNLGLAADSIHYVRRRLLMLRDREVAVDWAPKGDPFDGDVLPLFDGLLLDLAEFIGVEADGENGTVRAEVGATWRDAFQAAAQAQRLFPLLPVLPSNPFVGDLVDGTAVLTSYRGGFAGYVRNVDFLAPDTRYGKSGFDLVPNHATGYDLNGLLTVLGRNLVVPVSLTFRLLPAATVKGVRYRFPDGAALLQALTALHRSRLRPLRVAFGDPVAGSVGFGGDGFVLEVNLMGTEETAAAQARAVDPALGIPTPKGKGGEAEAKPSVPREEVDGLGHLLEEPRRGRYPFYLAEVRCHVAEAGPLWDELATWSQRMGDRYGLAGHLMESGTLSLLPFVRVDVTGRSTMGEPYDVPLNRGDRFDRVWEVVRIARKHPCRLRANQLLQLLNPDTNLQRRFQVARRIKEAMDLPNIVNPSGLLWVPETPR